MAKSNISDKRASKSTSTGEMTPIGKEWIPKKDLNSATELFTKQDRAPEKIASKTSQAHTLIILEKATERPESKMTSIEKMELASTGISKRELEQVKMKTALDYNQLAEVLSVSRATLINKKGNESTSAN